MAARRSRWATTFLATLFLPVAAAVGLGVALSLLLQLNADAMDLRVVALRRLPDGGIEEGPAPARSRQTAASWSWTSTEACCTPERARSRLVCQTQPMRMWQWSVLRLRGRSHLGATAFTVLRNYADRLSQRGGRLYLSGVDLTVVEPSSGRVIWSKTGRCVMVPASSRIGASTEAAFDEAQAWVSAHKGDERAGENDHGAPTDER